MFEEEKTCELASSSWEEISECNNEDVGVMSLSFFSFPEDSSESDHWDLVSAEDNEVKSLSNHSMTWTYRDALLLSKPKLQTAEQNKGRLLSVIVKKTTKIQVKPTIKPRRFPEEEKEEFNEHLLDLDDKPMSGKHRRKYERSARNRILRGRTGRASIAEECYQVSPESPVLNGLQTGEEHLTTLDKEFQGTSDHGGRTTTWNMNKKGSWNCIPGILEAEAVHVDSFSGGADRRMKEILRDAERPRRFIWIIPPRGPVVNSPQIEPRQVFAEIFKGPPSDIVDDPIITWTLRCKIGNRKSRKNVSINGSNALFVEDGLLLPGTQQHFFEIDLGETKIVTAISTQGAPPPVRTYPLRTDLAVPEGHADYQNGFSYNGPTWKVFDPSIVSPGADPRCRELRWVRSYKLYWRADHGHQWHCLGLFRGNVDTTTEKSNVFASIGIPELTCRFFRIVPVDCENGGALRIGIYGKIVDTSTQKVAQAEQTSKKRANWLNTRSTNSRQGPGEHVRG